MFATRRNFLRTAVGSSCLVSLSPSVPRFLLSSSLQAAEVPANSQRVLVVVQLAGGNDGLNTVIPYTDDEYGRNRFTLRIDPGQVIKINDQLGFHPSMATFGKLLEEGKLSVLQGVGYPNPNRSHFESMDIWHTASNTLPPISGGRATGWLGRYLDGAAPDAPAIFLGDQRLPLALASAQARSLAVSSLADFKLADGGDKNWRSALDRTAAAPRNPANPLTGFLQQSALRTFASVQRVQEALAKYSGAATYPPTTLAQQLRTVAQLIVAEMPTRIYYVSLDGFDTHANQGAAHAGLLMQLTEAVSAFCTDLAANGHLDRVMVMSFSEFGRRVRENASAGTDHGAAAPMFLAGGQVKAGLIGAHPSLTDLDEGDQKHHTDFRRVYATVLEKWLGCDSVPVLGGKYEPMDILKG